MFHTKQLERGRVNQNNGILMKGKMGSKSVNYFGVLIEIVELQYLFGEKKIVMSKYIWLVGC